MGLLDRGDSGMPGLQLTLGKGGPGDRISMALIELALERLSRSLR